MGISMDDLISVVIPTYNRAKTLPRAINSVLNQTYKNLELIIVDDASTDGTEEIIKEFKDSRIRFIKNEVNKGGSAARNIGINEAKGEFVAFQDSDDEWHLRKLEIQMEAMKVSSPNVGVVYCGLIRIQEGKSSYFPPKYFRNKDGNIVDTLKKQNIIGTQSALIKKSCFEKSGNFDETFPRLQDWELFIRIAKFYDFIFIDKPLVTVFHQEVSISSSPEKLIEALELIVQKHINIFDDKVGREALAYHFYVLGDLYRKSNDLKRCRQYFIQAIKKSPLKVRAWLNYLASLFPKSAYLNIQKLLKIIHGYKSSFINRLE